MAAFSAIASVAAPVLGAVGSVIGSGNNSSAIRESTEAQVAGNDASLALQSDIYNQNRESLSPFVNNGVEAGNTINALLGLGGSQPQQTQQQPNALTQFSGGQPAGQAYGLGDGFIGPGSFGGSGLASFAAQQQDANGFGNPTASGFLPQGGTYGYNVPQNTAGQPAQGVAGTTPQGQTSQQAANDAFGQYQDSTGYNFRLNEGYDAFNSGYAGAGLLQSGAALRGITEYGQNFASNEFGNYLGQLSNQQGTGLQAAGAQSGVGISFANSASNINQANANALSNSAVASANNNNALIGNLAGAAGSVFGSFG